jgi:hypothetical protein
MSSPVKPPQPQSYEKMIRSRRATERMIRRLQVVREQLDRESDAVKRGFNRKPDGTIAGSSSWSRECWLALPVLSPDPLARR